MTLETLADALKDMSTKGRARGESIASLTLFGIRYASEIREAPLPSVAATVQYLLTNTHIPTNRETHIRVGMQLAKYVVMKTP